MISCKENVLDIRLVARSEFDQDLLFSLGAFTTHKS